MDSIEFPVYVEISVTPKAAGAAKAVACRVAAALIALAAVAAISLGLEVSVFAFLLVFYLLRAGKGSRGSGPRELKAVRARLTVAGGQLELDLPASRLLGGRYVEQRYFADRAKGCSLTLGEKGGLAFRAADLVSEAVEGGAVLDRREHADGEVALVVVSDEARRELGGFLETNGL